MTTAEPRSLRWHVHHVLDSGIGHDRVGTIVNGALVLLIIGNVIAFAAETVPSIWAAYGPWLTAFDQFCVAVFTIEYGCRLWACVELPFLAGKPAWQARLEYVRRPMQLVDFIAIAPAYLAYLLPVDTTVLRMLRLLRFLKAARYSAALHSLLQVFREEWSALLGTMIITLSLTLFAGTVMHLIEGPVQPDKFGTVPDAMWWAIVTLGTIGYGDAVPVTALGKLFAGFVILLGVATFALPIAILSKGFSQEVARREFVVTWSLLARVPLFAGLDAAAVARVMGLLQSYHFEAGEMVMRAGSAGDEMMFIASGTVLVEADHGPVELGQGEFFGEMALLERRAHTHDVYAVTGCRILVLLRDDLERLGRSHPAVSERIRTTADARRAAGNAAGQRAPGAD